MTFHTDYGTIFTVLGAVLLLLSFRLVPTLMNAADFVTSRDRIAVIRQLRIRRLLILFLITGYLGIAFAFLQGWGLISKAFVGSIFFFLAVFILLGMKVFVSLIQGIQETIFGFLPICVHCKQIRKKGAGGKKGNTWVSIEEYLGERSHVQFSHGICPPCAKKYYPQ